MQRCRHSWGVFVVPMTVGDLDDRVLMVIDTIGRTRAPSEACGVLIPDGPGGNPRVVELPNRAPQHHQNFLFFSDDLLLAVKTWLTRVETDGATHWRDLTIWHTHPGGGMGPSTIDMRNKIPDLNHLVVTLTPEGPVPTWY